MEGEGSWQVVVVMEFAEFPVLQCVDCSDGRIWGSVWFCSSVVVVLCQLYQTWAMVGGESWAQNISFCRIRD